ncbi:MAG: class I SAM-dependent methyltransferase [Promethearchaeota archaeon]
MNNIVDENNVPSFNLKGQQIYAQTIATEHELIKEEMEIKAFNISIKEDEIHKFYRLPKYYDMAFSRDVDGDIKFFQKCFQLYSDVTVKRILEPACGTGILIESFPKFGYYALGYDLSPDMIEYTKERLINAGIFHDKADVLLGDMKNLEFDSKFDAAVVCINSLGYLTCDEDITSHFKVMGKSLKNGGIYIVELSCKCEDIRNEIKTDDKWFVKENGIYIELSWVINRYDVQSKIRHVDFQMIVNENGNQLVVDEVHKLRLWLFDDLILFASRGGFQYIGAYNQEYKPITESTPITGELGGLFFIFKNIKNI